MALISKMHPDTVNMSCQTLIHPYTSSCTYATLDMFVASLYGSAKFMAIVYSLHYLLKLCQDRKKAKAYLSKKTLLGYLQSVSYATASSSIFVASNCLSRLFFGSYNEFNCCFFSSFAGGLGILLEAPSRRRLVITSYANMAFDTLLRRLEETKTLTWTNNRLVMAFMACNALLMYLVRFGKNEQSFWFFTPGKLEKGEDQKIQNKELQELFLKYSLSGLAVTAGRLIFSDLMLLIKPWSLVASMLEWKNLSLGVFLGTYVIIYRVAENILSRPEWQLKDETVTLLAGLLAGTAFRFQASRTILVSAMVNVFQILLDQNSRNGSIPRLPYNEMLFCLYNGFLYHMRAMNPSAVPRTFIRIMSLVTTHRSDYIYGYYAKIAKHIL